jgi:2-C-methyl-D-erythritol 4-phosphate cytidylyltransferase
MRPTLAEIEATVDRLEARLAQSPDPATRNLLSTYHKLDARFRADLTDARDLALSRGAALMLIRFLDESRAGEAAR